MRKSGFGMSGGTLVVVLSSDDGLVVATDSRSKGTQTSDHTKKLFRLPDDRVVAVAGLGSVHLSAFPDLNLVVPRLLEWAIETGGTYDSLTWNDPPDLLTVRERMRETCGELPQYDFAWWSALKFPLQAIFAVRNSERLQHPPEWMLSALVAGYRSDGTVKIIRLGLWPETRPSADRLRVGCVHSEDAVIPIDGFAAAAIGRTVFATDVLNGRVPGELVENIGLYPAIPQFIETYRQKRQRHMSIQDMKALAHDLIRASAELYDSVGAQPLQTAVLRPGQTVEFDQPILVEPAAGLALRGAMRCAQDLAGDFPFAEETTNTFFISCRIDGNRSPIPIDGNWFFDCECVNATFLYRGGRVGFGLNNRLTNCRLLVAPNVDLSALEDMLQHFDHVAIGADAQEGGSVIKEGANGR